MGKESKKRRKSGHIYVYITDSLCCTPETNTNIVNQLYSNKIVFKLEEKKEYNNNGYIIMNPTWLIFFFIPTQL